MMSYKHTMTMLVTFTYHDLHAVMRMDFKRALGSDPDGDGCGTRHYTHTPYALASAISQSSDT